jgi:hypothetical protein
MTQVLNTLQRNGLIDAAGVQRASKAISEGQGLMNALMTCGVPEERLQEVLAAEFQYPYYSSLDSFTVSKDFLSRFPARVLLEKAVAPLREENGIVHAAIADPFDLEGIDQLRLMTGIDIAIGLAGRAEISRFVKKHCLGPIPSSRWWMRRVSMDSNTWFRRIWKMSI